MMESSLERGGPMTVGPVEYIVVGFPGNNFTGEIAPELAKLVESGAVRILDLLFIGKDAAGDVIVVEATELDAASGFATLDGEVGGLIGPEDIAHAGMALEPNSSAALLVWEDLWAAPFVDALRKADGVLLEGGRISHELITSAMAALPPSA
jgi:hypothetical protein